MDTQRLDIRRAAVLGAGVMGAGIAAHLANAGIPVLLLDLKPTEPDPAEAAKGLTLADEAVANRLARRGVQGALKAQPAAFFLPEAAELVSVGNLDDDLPRLAGCDWVVEAVVERLDVKQSLFARIEPHLKPEAVLSSNTSGLSCAALAEGLDAGRRARFCVTHFFNPPRYLKLMELVAGPDTDAAVMGALGAFLERRLGKGVVVAKDTPNFIANRIGIYAFMRAAAGLDEGFNVAEIDALTGTLLGRPKSATFRTADLVGLDTLLHVTENLHERLTHDPARSCFVPPPAVTAMAAQGWLGAKTGQGFYRKGKAGIEMLDLESMEYVPRPEAEVPPLEAKGLVPRLSELMARDDRAGRFVWGQVADVLHYAASLVPEISDNPADVDRAMRWGFGWRLGPFELWDALGVGTLAERMALDGRDVPDLVSDLAARGHESFYGAEQGASTVFLPAEGRQVPLPSRPRVLELGSLKATGGVIVRCDDAALVDLGDGVACLEFTSKMNTLTPMLGEFTMQALERVERDHAGLVVGNDAEHFSAGANLMLVLGALAQGGMGAVESMVAAFQQLNQSLRFARKPVVVATRGRVLGGGCELLMHGHAACAAAESYIGLVEVGAGLIPAGGGCKELLRRLDESVPADAPIDLFPMLQRLFEIVGTARVATSAAGAQQIGFLRRDDVVVMNDDHRLHDAKALVLGRAALDLPPRRPRSDIRVLGQSAFAAIQVGLFNFEEARALTPHDKVVGTHLARVLSGGEGPARKVSEQALLDLEREAFLSLLGEQATRDRMEHLLKTGKPLRN